MIKTKILLAVLFLFGVVSMPISYWCMFTTGTCYGTWVSHISLPITQPLYYFALFGALAVLISLFLRGKLYRSWLKFAAWFLPIAFVLVALTHVSSPYLFDFFPFYRADAARLAGELFTAGTILVVLISWWRGKRKTT